jgi:hypothetical protein
VQVLERAGFVVRADGGQLVNKLWGGEAVIDPSSGQQAVFPAGHVSVYHSSQSYWDQWHQADLANKDTPNVSPQLEAFYLLSKQ